MGKKVLIIGGVAGGASTAARLRRVDEEAEIIIFEKGEYISFANCGLPYYIGGTIKEREDLLVQTPERMESRFNIDVRILNEVVDVEPENKEVKVKDLTRDKVYSEDYDYLVLSPGAEPVKPPIPGIDGDRIFTLRTVPDTDLIKEHLDGEEVERAVVVGGGFIGLEMTENLHNQGLDVSLVEKADQVMPAVDYDIAALLQNHIRKRGVDLYLEDGVTAFEDKEGATEVILESGERLEADLVILSLGVKPNVELAKKAGLEIGDTGAIVVDEYLQTSDENIYAIGDAVEVKDFITGNKTHIPLAGPANKQGRILANNLAGRKEKFEASQGTSIAKVFELTVGSTGANEKALEEAGIDYEICFTFPNSHVTYYPGAEEMVLKTIFDPEDGQLLGAQIVGREGIDKRIDVLATALKFNKTVFDLQELELAYAPPYGAAKDPVNMAGYASGNILNGDMDVIHWFEIDDLDLDETYLFDVRTKREYKAGKINGAVNIPVDELRDRLDELPDTDEDIVLYCRVGIRAYIAARILVQKGFTQVRNLSGGYNLYDQIQKDKAARRE